ncbi:MAG: hypothetical protein KZQ93_15965 [Candidatus Thiodiazotropha sp. (ex Monitilora ramsayi)]|nr:hypothetical protein [Candidatus Thiodiazotropha sp. (ex Monitilora ramsayi)]
MESRSRLRSIGVVVGAVIVGAIGSGIWDRVLSPAIDGVMRFVADAYGSFSAGYRDAIYSQAADVALGLTSPLSMSLLVLVTVLLLGIYSASLIHLSGIFDLRANGPFAKINVLMLTLFTLAMGVISLLITSQSAAMDKTSVYSVRSMEIVRPYIGEEKYFLLRSEFFSVDSADSFYDFNGRLIKNAEDAGVQLPEYKPY